MSHQTCKDITIIADDVDSFEFIHSTAIAKRRRDTRFIFNSVLINRSLWEQSIRIKMIIIQNQRHSMYCCRYAYRRLPSARYNILLTLMNIKVYLNCRYILGRRLIPYPINRSFDAWRPILMRFARFWMEIESPKIGSNIERIIN